ncbi:MAG: hypothetical protein ABW199_11665 [Caulobacterales bacterium]
MARQPRRINVSNAAIELGFVAAAALLGAFGAPFVAIIVLAVAMVGYWIFSRRNSLGEMAKLNAMQLAVTAAGSIAILLLVLGGAYWLGALLHGAST